MFDRKASHATVVRSATRCPLSAVSSTTVATGRWHSEFADGKMALVELSRCGGLGNVGGGPRIEGIAGRRVFSHPADRRQTQHQPCTDAARTAEGCASKPLRIFAAATESGPISLNRVGFGNSGNLGAQTIDTEIEAKYREAIVCRDFVWGFSSLVDCVVAEGTGLQEARRSAGLLDVHPRDSPMSASATTHGVRTPAPRAGAMGGLPTCGFMGRQAAPGTPRAVFLPSFLPSQPGRAGTIQGEAVALE